MTNNHTPHTLLTNFDVSVDAGQLEVVLSLISKILNVSEPNLSLSYVICPPKY